ncbi:nucleotidyltransferase domain-containing protein [Phycicoccus sp. KQZ13P-1]|uniref:nucleotidyltransferase domain-containing protein n=1 Tax=Phycicoccus mangrovi TaxID=2840470 RepID=UPI001C004A48|nr:nucleotidyltransferase domain-containing protein [Phycicoccus mangrovi]MBT9257674.1 nucleotidyltransferase domain-containing protein [Phycicoccus mangrovi]
MSARFRARRQQALKVIEHARRWAAGQGDVRACVVVGSYAYNAPRMGSDVDIIIVTEERARYLHDLEFAAGIAPKARLIRSEEWGALTERRVRLPSGLIVEFGIVDPSWCSLPLDPGTEQVLGRACWVLHDDGSVAAALESLPMPPRHPAAGVYGDHLPTGSARGGGGVEPAVASREGSSL